jgi:peptide chain release factor 1
MRELIASYTKKDFRIETFAAGKNGGQNANKNQTAVRITHLPTGLMAESRETKSQLQNKKLAFGRLAEQIRQFHQAQVAPKPEISATVVRTYHEPDNRVKDHLTGLTQSYKHVIIDGCGEEMIISRRQASR